MTDMAEKRDAAAAIKETGRFFHSGHDPEDPAERSGMLCDSAPPFRDPAALTPIFL